MKQQPKSEFMRQCDGRKQQLYPHERFIAIYDDPTSHHESCHFQESRRIPQTTHNALLTLVLLKLLLQMLLKQISR